MIDQILNDFKEIPKMFLKYDPSVRSRFEIYLLLPGFKAILFHRISHFCWNKKLYFIGRLISETSRFLTNIEIHPGAIIGAGVMIDHGGNTIIGETTKIGDNVLIYHNVTLGSYSIGIHGQRHPIIGNNVVIGMGSSILGKVEIEDGVKIRCGKFVTRKINNIKIGGNFETYRAN